MKRLQRWMLLRHCRRAASGYLFGYAAWEAAHHLFEMVPGPEAAKAGAALLFLIALDEEAQSTLAEHQPEPVTVRLPR